MITPPAGVQVYLACGYTDMRKGMATLAMLVQQTLGHDPFSGAVFVWPMSAAGTVALTPGQLSTLLEGCEWRALARNLRPELAG